MKEQVSVLSTKQGYVGCLLSGIRSCRTRRLPLSLKLQSGTSSKYTAYKGRTEIGDTVIRSKKARENLSEATLGIGWNENRNEVLEVYIPTT